MTIKRDLQELTEQVNHLCDTQRQLIEWIMDARKGNIFAQKGLLEEFQKLEHLIESRISKAMAHKFSEIQPGETL